VLNQSNTLKRPQRGESRRSRCTFAAHMASLFTCQRSQKNRAGKSIDTALNLTAPTKKHNIRPIGGSVNTLFHFFQKISPRPFGTRFYYAGGPFRFAPPSHCCRTAATSPQIRNPDSQARNKPQSPNFPCLKRPPANMANAARQSTPIEPRIRPHSSLSS